MEQKNFKTKQEFFDYYDGSDLIRFATLYRETYNQELTSTILKQYGYW